LDSVLAQTFKDYEIIVVNDGSPDSEELEKALEPYRDRIIYLRQENQGPGGARNTGIRAARAHTLRHSMPTTCGTPSTWRRNLRCSKPTRPSMWCMPTPVSSAMYRKRAEPSWSYVLGGRGHLRAAGHAQCTVHICVSVCRRETLLRAGLFDPAFRRVRRHRHVAAHRETRGRIAYQRRVLG
jgi:hypothetical protein